MCGVIVVDAESFRSTQHGRDAYVNNHCLDILKTMRPSINCSAVICSPTVILAIMREATSETYAPRVYFQHTSSIYHHISFQSTILQSFIFRYINQKPKKNIFCLFLFISIRSHLCK